MSDSTDKAIVPIEPEQDVGWRDIVEKIVEQLDKEDLPGKVIEAIEYYLAGYPVHEIAKRIDEKPRTIRRWFSKYPIIAMVLTDQRNNLIRWRMGQLEKQFLQAAKRSDEILNVSLKKGGDVDSKVLSAVAQHTRYILGLFAGQKIDIHVTHDVGDTILQASKDSLEYIADVLAEQREKADADLEPIEATYRVIDSKFETGPLLTEEGEPHYGEVGTLDQNEEGFLCHICGNRYKYLKNHVKNMHNVDAHEYEMIFMLSNGSLESATPQSR
jgi:hypothetical protein